MVVAAKACSGSCRWPGCSTCASTSEVAHQPGLAQTLSALIKHFLQCTDEDLLQILEKRMVIDMDKVGPHSIGEVQDGVKGFDMNMLFVRWEFCHTPGHHHGLNGLGDAWFWFLGLPVPQLKVVL